jgi:hypothetical protein
MLMLWPKVADWKITEVETQVTRSRDEGAIFDIDAIQAVSPAMNLTPPRAQPTRLRTRSRSPSFIRLG